MSSRRDDAAERLRTFIEQAQEELVKLESRGEKVWDRVKEKEESMERTVKKNPLLAIGGALVIGYALGYLLRGRK